MDNEKRLPKIYLFVNSGKGTDWQIVCALSEDGEFLAEHCSSSEGWAKHDIGLVGDWKHEHYRERYPDGFDLEWVSESLRHEGVKAAYAKHIAAGEQGTPWQRERAGAKALETA